MDREEAYWAGIEPEDFEDGDILGENTVGCIFPGRCCMPGEHLKSECCTAEMMEQMRQENEA